MTEHVAHAHMTSSDDGAVVTAHADCTCGWVGTHHATLVQGVLHAWNMAVADRDDHQNPDLS